MSKFEDFLKMIDTVTVTPSTKLGLIIEGRMYKMTVVANNPRTMPMWVAEICDFIVDFDTMTYIKSRAGAIEVKQQVAFTINAYGQDLGNVRFLTMSERQRRDPFRFVDIVDQPAEVQAQASAEVLPSVTADDVVDEEDYGDDELHDQDCPVCWPDFHPDSQEH